jgi:hypothetical protein
MASHRKQSAKSEGGEFAKFKNFMGQLIAVPLREVRELEKQPRARKRKAKKHSASRAANGKS